MRDAFKGFLVLRLIGFLALLVVAAVVLGIRSLDRGSDVVGAVLLLGAVVAAAVIASLLARRANGRAR